MGQTYPADYFRRAKDWPRYNSNDGMYADLPRTLKQFYEQHKAEILAALKPSPPDVESATEMSPSP